MFRYQWNFFYSKHFFSLFHKDEAESFKFLISGISLKYCVAKYTLMITDIESRKLILFDKLSLFFSIPPQDNLAYTKLPFYLSCNPIP